MSTRCLSCDNRVQFLLLLLFVWLVFCFVLFYSFACSSYVGLPNKFIVNDNAKVSVLMNLLSVTAIEAKTKDKRVNLFLPSSKLHTFCFRGVSDHNVFVAPVRYFISAFLCFILDGSSIFLRCI